MTEIEKVIWATAYATRFERRLRELDDASLAAGEAVECARWAVRQVHFGHYDREVEAKRREALGVEGGETDGTV